MAALPSRGSPDQNDWLAPTMVQLELAKWLNREAREDIADRVIAFSQLCVVAPLDTEIALSAAEICGRLKLATADAVVYATALKYEAELLTCDARFDVLPGGGLPAESHQTEARSNLALIRSNGRLHPPGSPEGPRRRTQRRSGASLRDLPVRKL
jgi:uncharacterized protein